MKIITKQSQVKDRIINYISAHKNYCINSNFYTQERLDRIKALDPDTCTVEQYDTAMQNKHWSEHQCYYCGSDCDVLISLGQDDDDSFPVCKDCLTKALELLK